MLPVSPALASFLSAQQALPDSQMAIAEIFTLELENGDTLRYTSADADIEWDGDVYSASGPIIEGLKYNASVGLDIDQQEITVSVNYASPVQPTIDGVPMMEALAMGLMDGCHIQRDWVFFSDRVGGTAVGAITRYRGIFVEVRPGRLEARVTVANSLVMLNQDMPRRTFSPTCQHLFGGSLCQVALLGSTTWSSTTTSGSTPAVIHTKAASTVQIGGTLTFTSGPNAGQSRQIVLGNEGISVTVSPAFSSTPGVGNTFTISRANSISSVAGAGSTRSMLATAAALFLQIGGLVTFTSGANAGLTATVKNVTVGSNLWLATQMPHDVVPGDAFTITLGCDHTQATCTRVFNNLLNFLGFPQIPPPQTAI